MQFDITVDEKRPKLRFTAATHCLILFFYFGVVPRMLSLDAASPVPQARVDPRPIILPVIDGTEIRFTQPSITDGLSQIKVGQIVQDGERGFMWFGTQYGLNRFDSYNFKIFVPEPGNPKSLSGVFITSLFKARNGVL